MRPKPSREWVMKELERLQVRVALGYLTKVKENDDTEQPLYNIKLPIPLASINLVQIQSLNAVKFPYLHDRIALNHATLFSPAIFTWINATDDNYLHTFPELTSKQIRSYRAHSESTRLGHQHAQ